MFSVLCFTTYVLCLTASLGTSGTFTSELRSVLVYIARLVLVNYSVRKLTLYAPQPRLPSDSSASATFTSLTSVLLDLRSPRPPYPSTSVSVPPRELGSTSPCPLVVFVIPSVIRQVRDLPIGTSAVSRHVLNTLSYNIILSQPPSARSSLLLRTCRQDVSERPIG